MKTKVILLWCFLGAVIVTYLIVKTLVQDYNIENREFVDEMSEVQTSIIKGFDVINDYNRNINEIRNNTTSFSIVGKTQAPIPFKDGEELKSIIYNLTDYYKVEYTYQNVKYLIYTVNDYDLLEINVTSKKDYNKDLLAMYLGVDKSTLKSNQEKVRELKKNEVYGRTVVSNFEDKKAQFEKGELYFIVDNENIFKLDDLKTKMKDFDIYNKEYEINDEGKLLGYTFTKVLE